MEFKEIQNLIDKTFRDHFGYTPLKERLNDIQGEFFELMRSTDVKNLKEESGDLLASLIMLCSESDWNAEELILETLKKIEKRAIQYKALGRKTSVGILGGAFDPIHNGHIQLAQFVLNSTNEFDEIWLMPPYEHMFGKNMVSPEYRLEMCRLAAKVDNRIKVFDYEIKNKLKGETYYFFKRLKEEKEIMGQPAENFRFAMIIGLDNANVFHKWVNFEELEKMARFVVVPRKGVERDINVDWYLKPPHLFLNSETPIMDISSTEIRKFLNKPIEVQASNSHYSKYLDENVWNFIIENNLYKSI
jgi:nicotinate-nucleotide adenylyltransferase